MLQAINLFEDVRLPLALHAVESVLYEGKTFRQRIWAFSGFKSAKPDYKGAYPLIEENPEKFGADEQSFVARMDAARPAVKAVVWPDTLGKGKSKAPTIHAQIRRHPVLELIPDWYWPIVLPMWMLGWNDAPKKRITTVCPALGWGMLLRAYHGQVMPQIFEEEAARWLLHVAERTLSLTRQERWWTNDFPVEDPPDVPDKIPEHILADSKTALRRSMREAKELQAAAAKTQPAKTTTKSKSRAKKAATQTKRAGLSRKPQTKDNVKSAAIAEHSDGDEDPDAEDEWETEPVGGRASGDENDAPADNDEAEQDSEQDAEDVPHPKGKAAQKFRSQTHAQAERPAQQPPFEDGDLPWQKRYYEALETSVPPPPDQLVYEHSAFVEHAPGHIFVPGFGTPTLLHNAWRRVVASMELDDDERDEEVVAAQSERLKKAMKMKPEGHSEAIKGLAQQRQELRETLVGLADFVTKSPMGSDIAAVAMSDMVENIKVRSEMRQHLHMLTAQRCSAGHVCDSLCQGTRARV
jgi:hypothetical protein